jgi:clan AA aspartic protease
MGVFTQWIELGSPDGSRYEGVEAIVDTGATYTMVPRSMLDRLGVVPHRRTRLKLADGRVEERDVGRTWIRIDGESEVSLVVAGEEGTEPLLGAHALEGLGLAVDPVHKRLVPAVGYLLGLRQSGLIV